MKKMMICPKESGNTYKVASYVSNHSDVTLKIASQTTKDDLAGQDVIILASGVYLNRAHKNIKHSPRTRPRIFPQCNGFCRPGR